jgi:hypothetical protein
MLSIRLPPPNSWALTAGSNTATAEVNVEQTGGLRGHRRNHPGDGHVPSPGRQKHRGRVAHLCVGGAETVAVDRQLIGAFGGGAGGELPPGIVEGGGGGRTLYGPQGVDATPWHAESDATLALPDRRCDAVDAVDLVDL